MGGIARFWQSAIGKKVVMAVTGILLIGFLVSHVLSNLLVLSEPAKLDAYAEWLRSFGAWLWVARAGLLGLAVLHVVAATQLTLAARRARPAGYRELRPQVSTYAARTMRAGGVLLLVFIVFHILHFTTGTVHPDFVPGQVGRNVIVGFRMAPWTAGFYALAMVALGLHLGHGVWSVFQTLGANHPRYNRLRVVLAVTLAVAVAGGFFAIPVGVLAGLAGR